jgi:glycosyltransferase involved in cell wall biosynthesis
VIQAFAKCVKEFSDAKLIMIGEGELLQKSKALVEELKLTDSVQFTGALSQTDIALQYSNAMALVQHSITTAENDSEGTPLAIMEAGATGLPVISTWHAGIPDVVDDGITGFLVKEKDVNAMAEKMIYILENPLVAGSMGERAHEKITTQYSLEQYTKKKWEVINKS